MLFPNGKYPLNLNDPCWKEAYPPEQIELYKKQHIEKDLADPGRWDMCDYLCQFLPDLIVALAEHGQSYLGEMTAEEGKSVLHTMAQRFSDNYDLNTLICFRR